jgi:hypothetical protein
MLDSNSGPPTSQRGKRCDTLVPASRYPRKRRRRPVIDTPQAISVKPQTIDEYLAPLSDEKRAALEKLKAYDTSKGTIRFQADNPCRPLLCGSW